MTKENNLQFIITMHTVSEKNFNTFHLTTTKVCGNMKNETERVSFCKSAGIDHKKIVFANQVHGTMVKKVSRQDCGKFIDACDGLITDDKNIYLCIFTADCMPVFLAARDYSVVSLVHAGWRGLAKGVIESAITSFLQDFGISPQDITAYIGPHIQQCCYQVGDELKQAFNIEKNNDYFSLANRAQKQMKDIGLKNVYKSLRCSCHEYDTFFSYRREHTDSRMMSLIKAQNI